jgi:hypothetical protein
MTARVGDLIGAVASTPRRPDWLTEKDLANLEGIRKAAAKRDLGGVLAYAGVLDRELTARGHDSWQALAMLVPYFAGQILLVSLPGIPFAVFAVVAFWSIYSFTTRLGINVVGVLDRWLSRLPGIGPLQGFLKTAVTIVALVAGTGWGLWMGSAHPPILHLLNEGLVWLILWTWLLRALAAWMLRRRTSD